jgi:ADP-ribose pyrophosphatase YjhB (NUDIX family)
MLLRSDLRVKVDYKIRPDGIEYAFSQVDKKAAEAGIPHGCVYNLALRPDCTVLRIRRAKTKEPYPDHNSIPAGHLNVYEEDGQLICEEPLSAARRELAEETGFKPKKIAPILTDKLIKAEPHIGFVFACAVGQDAEPVYNEEIDPARSGFEDPGVIKDKLKDEPFTPPARLIFNLFFERYGTRDALAKLRKQLF